MSFQEVAVEHLPGLYALARHLSDGDADAEDLVQEGLLRAYRGFHSLDEPAAAGRWLRVIVTNVWRDGLRKRQRSPREVGFEDADDFSLYETLVEEDPFPYSDTLHLDFLGSFSEEAYIWSCAGSPSCTGRPSCFATSRSSPPRTSPACWASRSAPALGRLHRGRKLFEKAMWDYARESDTLAPQTAGVRGPR